MEEDLDLQVWDRRAHLIIETLSLFSAFFTGITVYVYSLILFFVCAVSWSLTLMLYVTAKRSVRSNSSSNGNSSVGRDKAKGNVGDSSGNGIFTLTGNSILYSALITVIIVIPVLISASYKLLPIVTDVQASIAILVTGSFLVVSWAYRLVTSSHDL